MLGQGAESCNSQPLFLGPFRLSFSFPLSSFPSPFLFPLMFSPLQVSSFIRSFPPFPFLSSFLGSCLLLSSFPFLLSLFLLFSFPWVLTSFSLPIFFPWILSPSLHFLFPYFPFPPFLLLSLGPFLLPSSLPLSLDLVSFPPHILFLSLSLIFSSPPFPLLFPSSFPSFHFPRSLCLLSSLLPFPPPGPPPFITAPLPRSRHSPLIDVRGAMRSGAAPRTATHQPESALAASGIIEVYGVVWWGGSESGE